MSDIKDRILKRIEAEENEALEKSRAAEDFYCRERSKLIETTVDKIYHQICDSLEHGTIYNAYKYSGILFGHTINKRFAMSQLLLELYHCHNTIDFVYNDVGDAWANSTWRILYSSQEDLDSIISNLNRKLHDSGIYSARHISSNNPIFPSAPNARYVLSNNRKWWTEQSDSVKYNYAIVTFWIFLD